MCFANIAVQKFLTRLYGCNFILPSHASKNYVGKEKESWRYHSSLKVKCAWFAIILASLATHFSLEGGWYVFWDNDVIPGTIFWDTVAKHWDLKFSKLCFINLFVEKVRWCCTFVVWLSTTTSPLNSIRFAIAACPSFMTSCHFVWCEKLCKGENVKICAVN